MVIGFKMCQLKSKAYSANKVRNVTGESLFMEKKRGMEKLIFS